MDYKKAWDELRNWLEKEMASVATDDDVSPAEYFMLQLVSHKMYYIEKS